MNFRLCELILVHLHVILWNFLLKFQILVKLNGTWILQKSYAFKGVFYYCISLNQSLRGKISLSRQNPGYRLSSMKQYFSYFKTIFARDITIANQPCRGSMQTQHDNKMTTYLSSFPFFLSLPTMCLPTHMYVMRTYFCYKFPKF